MKTKKFISRKTRKGYKKKNKTRTRGKARGGAWHESQNANGENWNGNNDENFTQREDTGYRNWNPPANNDHYNGNGNYYANQGNQGNGNGTNYVYDGDEDTDVDSDDDEQDYENYQEYIEDLTDGDGEGCASTTLEQKLEAVNIEIEKVAETYDTLVQGIANQTLGSFLETETLVASHSAALSEWHRDARQRATQFQRISEEDLKRAFLYLLPSFDAEKKYMVLGEEDEDSSMHVMIRYYAYKMITALFTRSNITHAVIRYNPNYHEHQFLENLLGVMYSASHITNQYLAEDWASFMEIPMEDDGYGPMYVHSGGNMTVIIAGMLCYLHDVWMARGYQYGQYDGSLLDVIRKEFDEALVAEHGSVDGFYNWLMAKMRDDEMFGYGIKKNTDKISDLDLIFMGPDELVDNIAENNHMFQINELSAYVLRKILVAAHRTDGSDESTCANNVMPFAGEFGDEWKRFKFSNLSGVREPAVAGMRDLHEEDYYGYRQSSNLVEGVPMYLNRIKQGYQPFFELDLNNIPEDLQYDYSNKYGECIDLSIGDKTNPLYNHKQENYMNGNYYTLDTILYELDFIIQQGRDDKYDKRVERFNFLSSINIPSVNTLFQIMGNRIS